jgi:putative ubiquitin-RnfH superfamily antitoxin RatB of RatAB toxin-antitoxin module
MRVTVAYAAPGIEAIETVDVAAGATVADAVERSGFIARHGIDVTRVVYAIHAQRARPQTPLADGDRIEITRPLRVDPKAERRVRAGTARKRKSDLAP